MNRKINMKRIVLMFVIISLVFAGCSINNIKLNKISSDYLIQCNVSNSTIDTIDFKKISSYNNTVPTRDLTYISSEMDDILDIIYDDELSDSKIINKYDVVGFTLELLDESEISIFLDKSAKLMIGMDFFDENLENDLIGKSINETYTFEASENLKDFYNISNAEKVIITPTKIYQYTERDETEDYLSRNGFSNFKEFYTYLFDLNVDEQDFENNSSIKDDFFKYAIDECTFSISSDDLKNFSNNVLEEYEQSAYSLNMDLEEYYTSVLSLDENEFFNMCAESAEYEIEKCLLIGALSQHFNINVEQEDIENFCIENGMDYTDSSISVYASYICLESQVVSEFVNLI